MPARSVLSTTWRQLYIAISNEGVSILENNNPLDLGAVIGSETGKE